MFGVHYPEERPSESGDPPEGWMPENEAASRLRVSRPTARRLLDGMGGCYGGRWWYSPEAVKAVAAEKQPPPGYVTAPEAIELLGYCSQSWLESLVDRGYVRVWYACGRKFYHAGDLDEYAKGRRGGA